MRKPIYYFHTTSGFSNRKHSNKLNYIYFIFYYLLEYRNNFYSSNPLTFFIMSLYEIWICWSTKCKKLHASDMPFVFYAKGWFFLITLMFLIHLLRFDRHVSIFFMDKQPFLYTCWLFDNYMLFIYVLSLYWYTIDGSGVGL